VAVKTTRRQALTLLGSTALVAACTPAIVSRDDRDPFEGGIGGTGIVGTLYGFGSLRINGLRVTLDGRTRYRTPFGAIALDMLQPGQTLTVSAQSTADGILARDVSVDYALVGLLRHGYGGLSVNGVPLVNAGAALGHCAPGTRVAVSGTWTHGGVRPSRIDPAPVAQDLMAGTVVATASGATGIGGVPVSGAQLPGTGAYAVALGRAGADGFETDRVHSGRFARLRDLSLLSVDGYLEPSPTAPGLRIAGLGHNFARDVRLTAIRQRRAIYFGRYNGLFGADRGYIVPDGFRARARALEAGLGDGFSGQVIRI
jgi:hypothetical protein